LEPRKTRFLTCLGIFIASLPTGAMRAANADEIVEIPVTFAVQNVNRSRVPCTADGLSYEVNGHIVASQALLETDAPTATLWLHGGTAGEWMWHFTAVPGYDFATEMAHLGHASVVIDRLGFDKSGHPDGTQLCNGAQADVAHQIIGQLRSGEYSMAAGVAAPRFSRVALGGQSGGAFMTQIEAYSFHDADGIVVVGWADQPISFVPRAGLEVALNALPVCARGGEPVEDDGSGAPGYVYAWPSRDAEIEDTMFDADPAVIAAMGPLINRDPCGYFTSVAAMFALDNVYVPTIDVPVLLVVGDHDLITPTEADLQRLRFSNSPEVSLAVIPHTGHTGMLERSAPVFRAAISNWLVAHGF
jgi:pimeloyl-ACP methyl ester carboxylesterase